MGRIFNWHCQNLNEDGEGKAKGSILLQGRGWLRLTFLRRILRENQKWMGEEQGWRWGTRDPGDEPIIGFEWHLPSHSTQISIARGGYSESDVTLSACCPLFGLYVHFERFIGCQWVNPTNGEARLKGWRAWLAEHWNTSDERELSFSIHNGGFWWNLWRPTDTWSSKTPKWLYGAFYPLDFLFGQEVFTETLTESQFTYIELPERKYPAQVKLAICTWKRPRLWIVKQRASAEVIPSPPVPIPGKGESEWDCDEDAIFSMTMHAENVAEAVQKITQDVQETRMRHGGQDWKPSGKVWSTEAKDSAGISAER